MTEEEWLTCAEPSRMMRFLRRKAGNGMELRSWFGHHFYGTLPKQWRRFLAACCDRVKPFLGRATGRRRQLVEFAKNYVDVIPDAEAIRRVQYWFGSADCNRQTVRLIWGLTSPLANAAGELRNMVAHHARTHTLAKEQRPIAEKAARDAEARAQCALIRDLFGNPFRSIALDASWRTSIVLAIAESIDAEQDFSVMPILGDALEDAGCEDQALLSHCRSLSPHVRGCWAVNLLLGRTSPEGESVQ